MSEGDIVKDFLVESYENLDRLDRELVGLEKDPHDRDALASVFRTIYTIKGTCGFLGFSKLEGVAHVGENLLSRPRDGHLTLTPEITTALLEMVDAVRQMLAEIQSTGQDGDGDYSELKATLTRLHQIVADRAGAAQTPAPPMRLAPENEESNRSTRVAQQPQGSHGHEKAPDTIRVGVNLLDKLMMLVGELVLARNQLLQVSGTSEQASLQAVSQRMNLITTELQEEVMKTRMQPVGNIWSQFPRIVRDVALACEKEVSIQMEGKETELDKTIMEAIKDPLTHLVRNAVDHGIELPDERVKSGKSRAGLLTLRASHENGQVTIEISDDGAGLDLDRIRKKAQGRELITNEQAAHMSEREISNLILLPGLSTTEKVTSVSGRGVGMDVVRTNVEKIGGTVDCSRQWGVERLFG